MPSIAEFVTSLNLPAEQIVNMSQKAVLDSNSAVFQSIKSAFAMKLATSHAQKNTGNKPKERVYIQHAVPMEDRMSLVSAFPKFDIKFSGLDVRAGALARAMSVLIVEYMLDTLTVKKGGVIAFGASLKTNVMRSRTWLHLCIAGHIAPNQMEARREDTAIVAMAHSLEREGKNSGLAGQYASGAVKIHCLSSHQCCHKARAGVADFAGIDTNFRQVAFFMRQHGLEVLQFSILGSKLLELCQEGPFPELGAYVFPSEGGRRINVSYKNDAAGDMSYLYANYLELVARTSVVLDGVTYHKEFVNSINGRLVYKVTTLRATYDDDLPDYKSWIDTDYRDKYMVYCPELMPGTSVDNPENWVMKSVSVQKSIIDDVLSFAMRSETPEKMDAAIKRRLHTKLSNFVFAGQVTRTPIVLRSDEFRMVSFVIYCRTFMQKFQQGATVKTIAPFARYMATLSSHTFAELAVNYSGVILGNLLRKSSVVTTSLRNLYRAVVGATDLPMPTFSVCPGYVSYSDVASGNPRFEGWELPGNDPYYGFSNALPGGVVVNLLHFETKTETIRTTVTTAVDIAALVAGGQGFVNEHGKFVTANDQLVTELVAGWYGSISSLLSDTFGRGSLKVPVSDVSVYEDTTRQSALGTVRVQQQAKPHTGSADAVNIAKAVSSAHDAGSRARKVELTEEAELMRGHVPVVVPGAISDDPLNSLRDAVMAIFPASLMVNTEHYESDVYFGHWNKTVNALRLSINISNMEAPKPEKFYLPLLRGHVKPDVKINTVTVAAAVVKRNADAHKNSDQLDVDFLIDRAMKAMFRVYYLPGSLEWLTAQPSIGPTYEAVLEWASRQEGKKRLRLPTDSEEYGFTALLDGTVNNQLMVKGKLKPAMEEDYLTTVKQPQTIQYDPSGKFVAVLSPVIDEKVRREKTILKPNILVLQGKSIEDINKFLNCFDHRPDERGARKYLEGDYTMYDKSQGKVVAEGYLRKLELFGVLPDMTEYVREYSYNRTVSSLKAGVKVWLREQNSSGAAYTLDRNNDVNLLVIAELLEKIESQIEFMIIMGDDFIVAYRGTIDVTSWEVEISRKFNLSIKLRSQLHGYICSMDVVHLPDGHSLVVPDVIKAALSFMDMSIKDNEKIAERYISYADRMRYVGDRRVQDYLSTALPGRYKTILPGVTPEAVRLLTQSHHALMSQEELFASMFASVPTQRFY